MSPTSKPAHAYTPPSSNPPEPLHNLTTSLSKALSSTLPSSSSPYKKVSVIAFHWAENDDGNDNDTDTTARRLAVDLESSLLNLPREFALSVKLLEWSFENAGVGTLRIYVYSGCAGFGRVNGGRLDIGAKVGKNGKLDGPTLDWWANRAAIECLEGDMCYIFTCCSAGPVAMQDGPETIAAAGWEEMAASSSMSFSFARGLIDVLEDLDGEPETLAGIYARLFRNAQQNQVGACPVLVPKDGEPSITLARLSKTKVTSRKQSGHLPAGPQHRVLLGVHLRDTPGEPDLDKWKKWLTQNIPPEFLSVDIKIESVFRGSGDTFLLLVTMPVEVWTMLSADDPSFTFVGHVNTNNVLPQMESNLQHSLWSPRPSGQENQQLTQRKRKSLG
ncbi:hypothetical protein FQN54_000641 [Arachnomyces sp. PD_36]|nr:hypothetical protein FQN54_000641 [Arachnomyces sp. PD_36]